MTKTGEAVVHRLNPKERKILVALCEGGSNREIGQRIDTTEQVIKNYLRSIYEKTGVTGRLELAIFAFHHGIVECPCGAQGQLSQCNP